MKALAAITLALAATGAFAETTIQLHGMSWHGSPRSEYDRSGKDWNEANVGLGLRKAFSDTWAAQAGFYRNSVDRTTVYVVADYTPLHLGPIRAGVTGGIATGYPMPHPLAAGGVVHIHRVTLRILPRIPDVTPFAVGVEYGVPF